MPKIRKPAPAPAGLNTAQRAELRALLGKVPAFDPLPPHDVGEDAPPELIEAIQYVMAHGIRTGAALRAYEAGDQWLIDSRIMDDLRRLAQA